MNALTIEQLKNKVWELAVESFPEVVLFRRYLHAHPELSGQEYQTAAFIEKQLQALGIPYRKGVCNTGILAAIECNEPESGTVALRADMDALPVTEKTGLPFRSVNEGVMHACGHDAHMACLLGAAIILTRLKMQLKGSIRLIFQPSEEMLPGGAKCLIEAGALDNPVPKCIIGQHVLPHLEAGKVGFITGPAMASSDEIHITIYGKGGHAATPDLLIDPVAIGSQLITTLQQVISRNAPPFVPSVLSFGRFIAEGSVNVIPDVAEIKGTLRTFNEQWRNQAKNLIRSISQSVCQGMGASVMADIRKGYPVLVNHPALTLRARHAAETLLGVGNVVEIEPRMTSEDFAYYSQVIPACFFRLGTRNAQAHPGINLHTATFDIDEKALLTGSALLAWLAMNELHNGDSEE